nr:HEPN domain-containing protein [uncultured Shimia sp.]
MLNEITELLDENLERVDNLVSLYGPPVVGRRKVHDTDVLRAALVLLHASLEDYLRSLLVWKVDTFDAQTLSEYGFPTGKPNPPKKFGLGDLLEHRGKSVDEFIAGAVRAHLEEFQSFNHLGEVKDALKKSGIPSQTVEGHDFGKLPEMIARRHNIVHKADRNTAAGGQGNHRTKSIGTKSVQEHIDAVKGLKDFVLNELGDV